MANIQGGRIEYTVGYTVDQNSLRTLQQQLTKISAMTTKDFLKINPQINTSLATQKLKEVQASAKAVEKAIYSAYNPKLNTTSLTKLNAELKTLNISKIYNDLGKVGTEGQRAFSAFAASALAANTTLKKTPTFVDKIGDTLKRTLTWNLSSSVINQFTGKFQEAYGYVQHLDSSLNDIRIVTSKSADEMDKFAEKANKAAKALGKSTTDYTNASLIYYQQGLSDEETAARTDVTLKAANVTQQSTAEVSEQLTAVWNGYKVSAEEAELYVDKLAAVAAATASDLEELSTGMSKVASAANLVGMDVDQMNAALATTISVTRQAPETVGTAYKTILARMTTIAAGGEDEGATLTSYTEDMNAFGINVLDATGHLRDMGDVVEEVGAKWSTMSKEAQISLAQTMAGTRQYNNLTALFDNWDMYQEALQTSQSSAGTLQKQQEIYMESVAAHLQQLQTASEGVMDSILDSDTIIAFADILTKVNEKVETIIDSVGNLKGLVFGFLSLLLSVYSKRIGSYLATTVSNIALIKKEAKTMQADIANVQLFAQSEGMNNKATATLVSYVSELQKYYRIASEEEVNRGKDIAKNIALLEDEINLQKQALTQGTQYLQSLKGTSSQQENIKRLKLEEGTLHSAGVRDANLLVNELQAKVSTAETGLGVGLSNEDITAEGANWVNLQNEIVKVKEKNDKATRELEKAEKDLEKAEKESNSSAEKSKQIRDKITQAKNQAKAATRELTKLESQEKTALTSVSSAYRAYNQALSESGGRNTKIVQNAKVKFTEAYKQEITYLERIQKSYQQGSKEANTYAAIVEQLKEKLSKTDNGTFTKKSDIQEAMKLLEQVKGTLASTSSQAKAAIEGTTAEVQENVQKQAASLEILKGSFKELINGLNAKAIGASVSALGSSISSVMFSFSAFNSIIETLNDETLTTEERLSRVGSSISMLLIQLPMVVSNVGSLVKNVSLVKDSIVAAQVASLKQASGIELMNAGLLRQNQLIGFNTAQNEYNNAAKAEATAQEAYNTAARDFNAGAITAETLATKKEALAQAIETKAKAANTLATYGLTAAVKGFLVTAAPYLLIIGAAAAAIFGIVKAWEAYVEAQTSAERALEESQKALEDAKEAYSNLSNEVSNLASLIDQLKEQKDALEELAEGTTEWNEALKKVKETTEQLLEDYPELQKYARYENGQWVLSEKDLEAFQEEKQSQLSSAEERKYAAQMVANRAEQAYQNTLNVNGVESRYYQAISKEDIEQSMSMLADRLGAENETLSIGELRKIMPYAFSEKSENVDGTENLDFLSEAFYDLIKDSSDIYGLGGYEDIKSSYEYGTLTKEDVLSQENAISSAFTRAGLTEFFKKITDAQDEQENLDKANYELVKAMLASSEEGNEISQQILDRYGNGKGGATTESEAIEKGYFNYAAKMGEEARKDAEVYLKENKPDYASLDPKEQVQGMKDYAQVLKDKGYTLITSIEDITEGNTKIRVDKDGTGENIEEINLKDSQYQDEIYNQFLARYYREQIELSAKQNKLIAEDFNEPLANLSNFLAENQPGELSQNELNNIADLINPYSMKTSEQSFKQNELLQAFGKTISDVESMLEEARRLAEERVSNTLTSNPEREAWATVTNLEGYGDISGSQQQELLNKIHDIYEQGADAGIEDFIESVKEEDIQVALQFEYEDDEFASLSTDLAKRLKTLKIDESTFNNYKAAFKKANEDVTNEAIVRWLEAQKEFNKIEKSKDDIFNSLSSVSSDTVLSSEQIDNLIQLEDAFEALSGLDLSQDWILQHLDLLKAYVEDVPGAVEALNTELNVVAATNDKLSAIALEFTSLDIGAEMPEKLRAAIEERYESNEEAQRKIAEFYGYSWDEEKKSYVKVQPISTLFQMLIAEKESEKVIDNSSLNYLAVILGKSKEEIIEAVKAIDPEATYDKETNSLELKTITFSQAFDFVFSGEKPDLQSYIAGSNNPDSEKTKTEKTYTRIERNTEFDVNYDSWDKLISYKEKELDRLEEAAENLTGDALLQNLEERKKIYDEINEQREQELKQNELDIETFKKQVEALGAEIDPETGYILNERDLKKGWSDSENAIANQYNQYINEDGSLTEAGQKLGDEEINKINKSYTNYKKTVEENKQAIENYNTALEKNIELLENSNEDLKSRAELQATQDILKVTNAYEQFSVSAAAAEEEVSKFENLLSDDKAVNERIADLAELGKKQKEELSAYESQLQGASKAQEDLLNTLKDKNIKIDLTGNIAQDTETIKNEVSSLGAEISNVEKKIKDASSDEKTQLEATLLQLLEKKEYLDQFADQWETINNDIEDTKKKIQDVNDALSTSVEEMQELSDWQTGSVDKQLETVERTLSRLQRRESRLTGQNLVNNLNKQKAIIQQQIKLEQNKLKILRQQLKTLQEQLRESLKQILVDQKISVKFEQDGSVNTTSLWNSLNANKDKISDEIRQEIVSLVNDINSKTSEINSLEDAIFGHQEDLKDMQDKIKDAVEEAAKKAMDRALEIFNAKVDFEVSIEDAWRQFDRLEAKVNGLREKSTELFQNALLDYSDAIRYVTANINSYFGEAGGGSIQILTQHVNDIMSEISIMQSGGKSSLYGIDQTTAFGDLENYYSQLMSAVEGFYDAIDSAKEKYGEAIDAIISKNEELLNDFEKIKSLQDHGISLTKLLYGEESFAQQQDYLDKQADVIQQQLEASIQQRDYYKNLLASLSPDDDNYDKVKQAYLDAMEEVYSYTEDRLNKLHDALMNQIDAQGAAIRDNLAAAAGFGSNGQMDRDWEYQTQLDEDYLDATNTQYEIDSLTNKFNEAISGTDSLAAKEKLTDVMNEQLDILNEQLEKGQKLTEYDVERANKVYELTLKQIALEEAQENKSKMRLRRDSQGNYRYEYVADQDKINKAKQDLLDAENDLYNFDKNRAKEMINSLNELLTEYHEKQKEITEDLELTEEERDAALLELQERYWGKQGLITMAKDEYLQASERMKEESVDDFSAYDDTLAASLAANWDSITQAVSENTTLLQEKARDTSEAIRETLDATTTGAEDLEGAINADTEAMAGLIEQDEELIDQYGEQIEAIQDLLLELENLEAQYRAVMDAALAAVDAALKLRQTSWETEEDEKEKEKANENDNDIGLNGNLGGNGSNNNDRYASVFISEDGFWAVANPAYNKKDLGAAIGKQFPSVQKILWENWNNEKARINKYKKKTVKYDTGGYTGAWGSEGKIAMLHEKELVLNKVDTANILQAVDIVRTLSSDLAALQNAAVANSSSVLMGNAPKETLEQNVKIEANFPNVTNSNEIEQAFNNLVNLASQRAMRK